MTTHNQPAKSRRLLSLILLLVVGISVAAVIYKQVVVPDSGDAATQDLVAAGSGEPGNGSSQPRDAQTVGNQGSSRPAQGEVTGIEGGDETGGQVSGGGTPVVTSAGGGMRTPAGGSAAYRSAAGTTTAGGVVNTESEDTPSFPTASSAAAVGTGGADNTGGGNTTDSGGEAGPTDASGDTADTGGEAQEFVEGPFSGFWNGRIEAGITTTDDGKWTCAGADINYMRLLYNTKLDSYYLAGRARLDNGYLNSDKNRELNRSLNFGGDVSGTGRVNVESGQIPKYWGSFAPGDYKAQYSGQFTETGGTGTWQDTLGCSGSWSVAKQQDAG